MTRLPIPSHFQPASVGEVWRVPYQQRSIEAKSWAQKHQLTPTSQGSSNVKLLLIDVQNTFCLPEFELFVGGRSGRGAIEDNVRLCEFIYRNLGEIDQIIATMDTHHLHQIFHPSFWLDKNGEHPTPAVTTITPEDVRSGKWQVNPKFGEDPVQLQAYALHYVQQLSDGGKYPLLIWPYHAMLGGIGHALVPAVEEAIFFHGIARDSQAMFSIKGDRTLTENYSALAPEVFTNQLGETIAAKDDSLIQHLLAADKLIIAGQAQSHCVVWTVSDLLTEINTIDPQLARKVYLLADCTSPVVIPGIVDYTDVAEAAYQRFADAGMNIIRSTDDL
ncbi:isochorismatase [Chamaesiphon polymorphus]|uniref:Isochorismatase n=1 Tax=Chamaesiphon polymorphus CCALA 037 TaxID=2107692 RepID=A0A2T1GGB7_9CYAN|nr:isochorismatase [Chamaesiphon polymorphus]PSB56657.1 isochorismatase [Chamaesiphon polymorphus CCALA 037]